ncbi:hypothetical protein NLU13_8561 [Sarocladium strictum]|uniref:Peptidase M3A/M3B catalytic domain-containing protein n=1 Tax=Sarocladium strictum TaxID=5046 RepID=A0AA39GBX3_SARSR|nr:hypothetical protein NLU13_8561 [Sarocladium strictum]
MAVQKQPLQPLPYILGPEEIIPTIQRHIDEHREVIKTVSAIDVSNASFSNVIAPLVHLANAQAGEQAVVDALKYCTPRDYQQKVEEAQMMLEEYLSSVRDRHLYNLIKAAKEAGGHDLDQESQKLMNKMVLEFQEHGYGILDDAGIRKRAERTSRINQLCNDINRKLREDNSGVYFSPEEVDGLPTSAREPPSSPDGKEFYSHVGKYMTVVRNAHDPETRRRMLLSYYASCPENVPLFREVILLRDEHARELGASSHAEAKIPDRLAQSIEWVEGLMDSLTRALLPSAWEDYKRICATKERLLRDTGTDANNEGSSDRLMPWDYLYYSKISSDGQKSGNEEAISEYFPLHHTFSAMLQLFADNLQIRFDPISNKELINKVWHKDVQAWSVWEDQPSSQGGFIGYFFADMLGRPDKYKGNQSVNLQPGYLKPDGTRVYPANILMCGFQLSAGSGYLLSHYQVVTLFHELGHSIHDLLARTRYARFHGYQVPLELGEGIAMMLEHFCWLPEVLRSLSLHFTRVDKAFMDGWIKQHPGRELPSEKLPEGLLDVVMTRRAKGKVFKTLGIMVDVLFDLAVHNPSSRDALLQLNEVELYKDIYHRLKFRKLPDPSYSHAQNGLLVSGYDAGYYAYIIAEILAADMFHLVFAKDPFSKDAWQVLRKGLLEYGGSRDEVQVVESFLGGRPTNPEALLAVLDVPR